MALGEAPAPRRQAGRHLDHLRDLATLDRLVQQPVDQQVAGEQEVLEPGAAERLGDRHRRLRRPVHQSPPRGRQRRMGEAVAGPDGGRVVRGRADRCSRLGHRPTIFTEDEESGTRPGVGGRRRLRAGGWRPAASRRRHPDRGPRRLLSARSAARPQRADHAARRRADLDGLRRPATEAGDDLDRVRPPRLGGHDRPAGLLGGAPDRDDDEDGPQALPGGDRRQRLRQGRGQAARTGALPGLLPDHALQRPAQGRRPRPSSPTRT